MQQAALLSKCVLGLELEWQPPDAWPAPSHGAVVLQDSLLYQPFPHSLASHCGREGGHCQLEVVTLGKESSPSPHGAVPETPTFGSSPWVSSCPSGPHSQSFTCRQNLEISFER